MPVTIRPITERDIEGFRKAIISNMALDSYLRLQSFSMKPSSMPRSLIAALWESCIGV